MAGGAFGSAGLGSYSSTPVGTTETMVGTSGVVIDMTKVTLVHQDTTPQVPDFAKPLTIPTMRQVPRPIVSASLSVGTGNGGARKRPAGL